MRGSPEGHKGRGDILAKMRLKFAQLISCRWNSGGRSLSLSLKTVTAEPAFSHFELTAFELRFLVKDFVASPMAQAFAKIPVASPLPTAPPHPRDLARQLDQRQLTTDTCGWIDGDFGKPPYSLSYQGFY